MTDVSVIERIRGVRSETGANRPFAIDDPERVHYVERGHLDLFVVESSDGEVVGRRRFAARIRSGEMAFGTSPLVVSDEPQRALGLLAVPSQDAVIIEGERAGVGSGSFDLATTDWVDRWISHLSDFLVRDLPPQPDALLLEADPDVPYAAGSVLTAQHLDVVWVSANTPMRLLGRHDLIVTISEPLFPVSERTWLELDSDAKVSAVYTPTALVMERLWPAFDHFGAQVLEFALLTEFEEAETLIARRRQTREAQRASVGAALRGLGRVLRATSEDVRARAEGRSPLQHAVHLVAESLGVTLEIPRIAGDGTADASPRETIELLARRSRMQTRWLRLTPGWWRRAGPSMVGFFVGDDGNADETRPLALLSDDRGTYRAVNPETGASFVVSRRTASEIAPDSLGLYAPLPIRIEGIRDVLRFSLHGRGRDFRTLIALGALGGLSALLTPILTGQILVEIIPRGDISLWLVTFGALVMVALGSAVFEIVRGLASLRIETRTDERLQAAIWSRLVSLPAPFFRRFTAGDLASRANGVAAIRQALTGAAVQAAMGAIFSVFSLALLFYYSGLLALLVTGLLLLLATGNWLLSLGQLRHDRKAYRAQGELSGFVFQVISGLAKLRVAHAESYALAHWARLYGQQKGEGLAARHWAAGQQVLGGLFQSISLIVIFAVIQRMLSQGTSFDLVDFLSFNAAFGQLAGAVTAISGAVTTVVGIIPLVERVRPILDAEPEPARGIDPGELKGDIEFENVTFRYQPDRPNAVDGVSFKVRQGDYVAFVGPSGCGKSTLYRLLVGFEAPDSGTVFLDGHNLTSLDLARVRGRMGVVLQHGQIVAGTIYENIAGVSPLGTEEAWAAARDAALEDDIRAMAMGMRTVLSEGGTGLSVGQKQRLLIARALARKPRVLLFDEATSALDNRAQAMVQESLRKRGVTRLVIAHRLSSIRDVDRIFVMDAGRVIESGTHDQLLKRDGMFAALSRRQLVEA
ncbi:NHLP bacteriocin export ABC transporter permease/ATPase subunit [Candidatus Palauibacter sp.]|uniref:NHLP bacteriocin export ABC transporter permease/ATPase subunit n=1 Tax=Candidatus Palauibacter sp. TaxID=3101350 RepID=UPI003AF2F486